MKLRDARSSPRPTAAPKAHSKLHASNNFARNTVSHFESELKSITDDSSSETIEALKQHNEQVA
jgi:hypothetical protein